MTYSATPGSAVNTYAIPGGSVTTSFLTSSPATAYLLTSYTFPNGTGRRFDYDGLGRIIKVSLPDGSAPQTISYDATGLRLTKTLANGDSTSTLLSLDGSVLSATDPDGNVFKSGFDSNGLLTSLLSPDGAGISIQTASNGLPATQTNADGATTSFGYDAVGRIVKVTDANGNAVSLAYTAASQIQDLSFVDGTSVQYAYDNQGSVSQVTDRAGQVLSFTRDSKGRVISRTYSGGLTVSFTYTPAGSLATASGPEGTTTYTYDAANRVASITYPGGRSSSYVYDPSGRLAQESDQGGVIANYAYDAIGRLTQVTDHAGALVVSYTYDALSRLAAKTFGNGTKTVYTYDHRGLLHSISNLDLSGAVVSSLTYAYSVLGLPVSVTDQAGAITTYSYDPSGQLTRVVLPGGRTITYSYDLNGNRTQMVDSSAGTSNYTVNALNEYASAGSATFTYDANGDMATMTDGSGTTTYTYSPDHRLLSAAGPAGTFTYTYDAQNNLISFTKNGVRTDLVYNAFGEIIGEYDAAGNRIATFHYGLGLESRTAAGNANFFYQADNLGNVTAATNDLGVVTTQLSYLPFGEKLAATGATGELFTYGGAVGTLDLGDGFYQTRSRTYSPALGRFLQPDPSGFGGLDANFYRYASNSPIAFSDPGGLAIPPVGAGGGGGDYNNDYNSGPKESGTPGNSSGGNAGDTGIVKPVDMSPQGGDRPDNPEQNLGGDGGGGDPPPDTTGDNADGTAHRGTDEFQQTKVDNDWQMQKALGTLALMALAAARHKAGMENTAQLFDRTYVDIVRREIPILAQKIPQLLDPTVRTRPRVPVIVTPPADPDNPDSPPIVRPRNPILDVDLTLIQIHQVLHQLTSSDPNEIVGPGGFGGSKFIAAGQNLAYTIFFQNKPTASAPAQQVVVTTVLDPNVDLSTFQLTSIGWGNFTQSVPAGLQSYSVRVSYVQPDTGKTILVDIVASLNATTRTLTWTLKTLDPATLDLPGDALAGFLPPDDASGRGVGFVSYSAALNPNIPTGASVSAAASIVFDTNAAISTNTWTNTIDAAAPGSVVNALPAQTLTTAIPVSWIGSDAGNESGLQSFSIFVSIDGGPYSLWLNTPAASAVYLAQPGHTYAFYSTATDNVGNTSAVPAAAQATTTVPAIARSLVVSAGKHVSYTDAAGQLVTITLTGPGIGTLNFLSNGSADPISFALDGTTAKTSVSIRVARTAGAPLAPLTSVIVSGSLAGFIAPGMTLIGSLHVIGTLGNLTLGGVTTGPATIIIDGAVLPTSYRFGAVHDLSLTSAGGIKTLQADSWTSGPFSTDSITAPFLGVAKIRGNFDAFLTLTSTSLAIRNFTVGGAIAGGMWSIAGSVGTITAASTAASWSATIAGSLKLLSTRGPVAGTLTVTSLDSLHAAGDDALILTVTGAQAVRSIAIRGALRAGAWSFGGAVTSITAASVSIGFAAASTGAIRSLIIKGDDAGSFSAASATTIRIGGNMTGALLTLTTPMLAKTFTLRSFSVGGTFLNSAVRSAGSIGAVTVGGASGSTLFAGVSSIVPSGALPASAADFTASAAIGTFTSRSRSPFTDTVIAASDLGAIALGRVTTANAGKVFGAAGTSLKSFSFTDIGHPPFHWTSHQPRARLATLPGDLQVVFD